MTLEEVQAREAIRHTIATYNKCGDEDDARGFADCFTQDGKFESRLGSYDGREAIYAWKAKGTTFSHGPGGTSAAFRVHHITNIHIEMLSQDRAKTRAPWFVITDIGPDHAGIYYDTFRRENGKWLIEKRVVDMLWRAENSFTPPMDGTVTA